MPCPLLCGDPATQPLLPCLGLGSIQGPDRYCASRGRASASLHGYVCVCGVKCANSSYIPLLTDLGTGEGVQKNQHEEGTTRYWWMPPKLREPKAWILPLNGSSLQGIILGTTEQVGRSGAGSQDYPSLLFGSQRVLPCFFLFNGNSKCQPRAEVANAR